jgi:hypothetical protein
MVAAGRDGQWTNWAGNVSFTPDGGVREPSSEAEICAHVREAARRRVPIRVVGHGHSFNRSMCADGGVSLNLRKYKRVLRVDGAACTVTCEAGITLVQLCEALADAQPPLTLENVPVVIAVTVAGALATAAHGSGARSPSLSAQMLECTLVNGRGEVMTIDRTTNAELLPAARASLGVLGILSTVTLQCVPARDLFISEGPLQLSECVMRLSELRERFEYFKAWWIPHTGFVHAFCIDTKPVPPIAQIALDPLSIREATDSRAQPPAPAGIDTKLMPVAGAVARAGAADGGGGAAIGLAGELARVLAPRLPASASASASVPSSALAALRGDMTAQHLRAEHLNSRAGGAVMEGMLAIAARSPEATPLINSALRPLLYPTLETSEASYLVQCNEHRGLSESVGVRFQVSEFAIPAENAQSALSELVQVLQRQAGLYLSFPVGAVRHSPLLPAAPPYLPATLGGRGRLRFSLSLAAGRSHPLSPPPFPLLSRPPSPPRSLPARALIRHAPSPPLPSPSAPRPSPTRLPPSVRRWTSASAPPTTSGSRPRTGARRPGLAFPPSGHSTKRLRMPTCSEHSKGS